MPDGVSWQWVIIRSLRSVSLERTSSYRSDIRFSFASISFSSSNFSWALRLSFFFWISEAYLRDISHAVFSFFWFSFISSAVSNWLYRDSHCYDNYVLALVNSKRVFDFSASSCFIFSSDWPWAESWISELYLVSNVYSSSVLYAVEVLLKLLSLTSSCAWSY